MRQPYHNGNSQGRSQGQSQEQYQGQYQGQYQDRPDMQYDAPQMRAYSRRSQTRKKQMSLGMMLLIDTAIMGLCLLALCGYMFLIPRPLAAEGGVVSTVPPRQSSSAATAAPQATFAPGAGQTAQPVITQAPIGNNAAAQATNAPVQDANGWFPEKYTAGDVVKTDTSYQSGNVNITTKKVQENGITYFVADIYVRSVDHLRTYFANDTFGSGIRQSVSDMAKASNAILAISGDYYGNQSKGVVIRNGEIYRKSVNSDVCVLYQDGTMKTYDQAGFSTDDAINQGAYQAWSFGPKLLRDGQPMTDFNTSVGVANPRSSIGYYEPGHYCFVVVDGRQPGYSDGISMKDLSNLFYNLGCEDAYNLDGGQTAQMYFGGTIISQPYHGGRDLSDIIYIGE